MHRPRFSRINIRKEVNEVFIHSFLKSLGLSLISIFIPLYLVDTGFTVLQVGMFFLCFYLFDFLVTVPCYHLSARLGYKRIALLSAPFLVVYYLLLRSFSAPLLLYASTFVGALGKSLYWAGMNAETAVSTHEKKRDDEVGLFYSMPTLASIFSPVLGGVIAAYAGFETLFLVTGFLVGGFFCPSFSKWETFRRPGNWFLRFYQER